MYTGYSSPSAMLWCEVFYLVTKNLPHFFPAWTQMFSAEMQPKAILIVVASFVFGTKQRCTCRLWPVLELELWLPPRFLTTRGADSSSLRSIGTSEGKTKKQQEWWYLTISVQMIDAILQVSTCCWTWLKWSFRFHVYNIKFWNRNTSLDMRFKFVHLK